MTKGATHIPQPGTGQVNIAADNIASNPTSKTALANQLCDEALGNYRRPDGYEGHLVDVAWQLEQFGHDAWPVLHSLIATQAPELEFFLAAIVRLEDVPTEERADALKLATRHPAVGVRSRLLELLDEVPPSLRGGVLRELATDGQPDDDVTERAREALGQQTP